MLKGEPVTMLLNGDKFIIHKLSEPCDLLNDTTEHNNNHNNNNNNNNTDSDSIHPAKEFVIKTYPKQKYLLFVVDILNSKNLIDHNLYCTSLSQKIHLADVFAFFNNRFGKHESTDPKLIKFCKSLQRHDVKFPKVSIKNPVAQKYVC